MTMRRGMGAHPMQDKNNPEIILNYCERRTDIRCNIKCFGFIKISNANKEIHYKPVIVVDISKGGAKIIAVNSSSSTFHMFRECTSLILSFYIPYSSSSLWMPCKAVYFQDGRHLFVGISFLNSIDAMEFARICVDFSTST